MIRPQVLMVTPLPPLETGLATYAMRVLEGTSDLFDWEVAYTSGSDPSVLPCGMDALPVEELLQPPDLRVFQLGNSPHCFEVLEALYRFGGTGLFHEMHLHHMIRHCCLQRGMLEHYRTELRFEYGPGAERVERILSRIPSSPREYDVRLKRFPLTAMAVDACSSAVCLNGYAASMLAGRVGKLFTIGHPLSSLPDDIGPMEKPGDPVIGMAGGFHHGRNLDSVIGAMEILRRREPGAVLLLVGGGYPNGLPGWVYNTGRLPEDQYQRWIRTMDIAVDLRHPPLGETSGSLLEVMRAGVPAVVTASGAFLELPSDAVLRVPIEDLAGGAAAALVMLLKRPELRASMSSAAASWAEDQGSWERMRAEWTGLIEAFQLPGNETAAAADTGRYSLSPAWHDPPEGFRRDISGPAVTWRFEGTACLPAPDRADGAWVTARGEGIVSGMTLHEDYRVIEITTPVIRFEGTGEVSDIYWFRR
jgi:glycosyltransferase involved in cell wall biosynthesis